MWGREWSVAAGRSGTGMRAPQGELRRVQLIQHPGSAAVDVRRRWPGAGFDVGHLNRFVIAHLPSRARNL